MKLLLHLCLAIMSVPLFLMHAYAQVQRCHTMEYLEELRKNDPKIDEQIAKARTLASQYLNSAPSQKRGLQDLIVIPVVIHVLHNGEAVGAGKNISDAQILSQITVLNQDYQALNSDIVNVPPHFTSFIGNLGVEFRLATIDPQGNPTNGIDRVDIGAGGTWSDNLKPTTVWDASQYLNLWISQLSGGTLGYTTFPGTSLNYDGVVIDYRYFGKAPANPFPGNFDLGRTATHEIGHWLGLEHTFQGGCSGTSSANCASSGDQICDTPPTQSANYGCSLSTSRNTCTETPVDLPDMWMNYMDYMDDACLLMFSKGQVDEMTAVLNTSRLGIRNSTAADDQNLFSYSGQVIDSKTGQGVANAKVLFQGSKIYELETDGNGNFNSPNFRSGSYAIYAGKWGYVTIEYSTSTQIDSTSSLITIPIEPGYYDDFILDYGWVGSGNAASGLWERGVPVETDFNGVISNPGEDITEDYGSKSYITGNGGGSAGNDDVDDGNVILTSPVFDLTDYNDPYISYYRWFFNGGGQGNPDDQLSIRISNGAETKTIETLDAAILNSNLWNRNNIRLKDFITPTATMIFILETSDEASTGHLVEAGLDGFMVVDSFPSSIYSGNLDDAFQIFIYPNPAAGILNIDIKSPELNVEMIIIDISGKVIRESLVVQGNTVSQIDIADYPKGIYCLKLLTEKSLVVRKFIVLR